MSMFRNLLVQAGGGLPATYQEVEYIQSDGLQYIDTGVTGTSDTTLTATYAVAGKKDVVATLIGAEKGFNVTSAATKYYIGVYRVGYSYGYIHMGLTDIAPFNISGGGQNVKMDLTYDGSTLTLKSANNQTTNVSISSSGVVDTELTMTIFALNRTVGASTTPEMADRGALKLYALTISKAGTLVRDFVPCYRKSDNVAGLYDLVNGVFYTNAGSGTFTVGPDV